MTFGRSTEPRKKKLMNKKLMIAVGAAVLMTVAGGVVYSKAVRDVPQDGVGAKVRRFSGLQNLRYCEVFLIGGNGITKDLTAAFYNTTELNIGSDPLDTCPQEMWDQVDAEELKQKHDVLAVFKNGPRYWCYDWIELPVGGVHEFNGLQARWFGQVDLPKNLSVGEKGGTAFKPTTVARASKQGYVKGQTVYILDDPEGTPWVMQAYSNTVDSTLRAADLPTLDKKLKLPEGWKYRVAVLEDDLQINAINGVARIVQDDLENTYNALFEQDGQKSYNFKP